MSDNHCVIALRLARAAATAAAGIALTLAQLGLPSKQLWDDHKALLWASVAVVALFVCYDAVREVNLAMQASRIRDYDNDLRAALSAVVSAVVAFSGVAWDELAVHYYRRRGAFGRYRLERVGAVQAGAAVADAQTAVRPGIGVVGTAFSTEVIVAEEWRAFVRTATSEGPSTWAGRSSRDRYGLTWGQLRRSAQPDGMVASPTFAVDGSPHGCILVSGPLKKQDMTSEDMRRALDDVATTLDLLGPPPRGWWGAHERR